MATMCFRPPPLPQRKSNQQVWCRFKNNKATDMQSPTYHSFFDPADEDEMNDAIELKELKSTKQHIRINKRVLRTNSFGTRHNQKQFLIRSHSDGNLNMARKDNGFTPLSINRYIKVLSGSWKNLFHLGGMSRPPKPLATPKKVAPPAVPHEFRHSGSSFGSAGYASSEESQFLTSTESSNIVRDDHSDYGSAGKSPALIFPGPTFTFPGQPPPGGVLTHKAAVYYHHQLSLQDDQGIDMTQSPGRDSPGSSSGSAGSGSRHSTASLDSGRASYHPLSSSTAGRSTIGSSSSPRCSLSSCSIGSDQGRIERMILQGVPDHEIIHTFLVEFQFDEYFPLFIASGYDLPTIGRMTPEDLTAIGIKNPNHRKRLKAEIAQLNLPDNLPEFIPGSLEEWLQLLRLEEYLPAFLEQGYHTVDNVTQLTWEDLEEFGIVKLGHQKKIMLAIKRIKDVRAGKRISTDSRSFTTQDIMVHAPLGPTTPAIAAVHHNFHSSCLQPWEMSPNNNFVIGTHYGPPMFCTDIVPIQIRTGRGKSLESLEDPLERTHHTFGVEPTTQPFFYQQPIGWRPRSYDDGDITPTNESAMFYEGGGTLPRPRGVIRPRPIAKIAAKARDPFPDFERPQFNPENYSNPQYKSIMAKDLIDTSKYHIQYSPMMGKKVPPNPPKRQDSEHTTTVEIHHVQTSSPLPLPAYPSSDSLSISLDTQGDLQLPPPPAPGTPPHCKLISSHSWGAEEQELIKTLALQHRNGSDASFKSSSSTESDSIPFANENAGTIRTRAGNNNRATSDYSPVNKTRSGLPPHPSPTPNNRQTAMQRSQRAEPADVLNDIGNMLANLTDELDAMLEEEKRQQ